MAHRIDVTKERLVNLYVRERRSISECAEMLGCAYSSVIRKLRIYAIKSRPRGHKTNEIIITKKQLETLYVRKGLSLRKCAEVLGLPTTGGLSYRLRKFGIKARPGKFQKGKKQTWHKKGENHPSWKGGRKSIPCTQCGKPIQKFSSLVMRMNFCNQVCYGKWRIDNFKGPSNPNFGNDVLAGEGNPNWLGGLSREPYPIAWSFRKHEEIRNRDDRLCRLCGVGEKNGTRHDVHHMDYDKQNLSDFNLVTLCHPCHMQTSYHRDRWKKVFAQLVGIKRR